MTKTSTPNANDVSVVLVGRAGQGIRTVEHLLTAALKLAGLNVFATKEYMSRVRGGTNSTLIRASSGPVAAFSHKIDILIPLDPNAVNHVKERITSETILLTETSSLPDNFDPSSCKCIDVSFDKIASEVGGKIYSNTVAVGTIAGLLETDPQKLIEFIKHSFQSKSEEIVQNNSKAAKAGLDLAKKISSQHNLSFQLERNPEVNNHLLLSGAQAVSLGALAGGCNFISAYPMSPSTGVLTFLAQHAHQFALIAEQAEDEIAAVNMALGAWYAGARAMVSTSGGGFALMTEGLSLAAMLESPLVIHLAQRPAPATGLPTRTEQADLNLALYAGHGEFPRIILAPGTLQQAFYLTQKAFNLADKYQVPVIVLTDQYLMDSFYNIPSLDIDNLKIETHITETSEDYCRHEFTENGISPRGIPGLGKGLVAVDSDEHDTEGHITENLDLRTKMVDKRIKKGCTLAPETIPPRLVGPEHYKTLVIAWGSNYHIACEAINRIDSPEIALLHFSQLHPLHTRTAEYIKKAETTIIVENNATSQFSQLIKLNTSLEIGHKVLKYNGMPFAVEEIQHKITEILK